MLPIYPNGCLRVAIDFSYGIFVAVDNLGISWQKSHKKPNKTLISCGFIRFAVGDRERSLGFHQTGLNDPNLPR